MKLDFTNLKEFINPSFYPLLSDRHRYMVLWGGAGSGKSYSTAQKIVLRILAAMDRGYSEKFLVLRKTQPAARRSVFELFQGEGGEPGILPKWKLKGLYKANKSDMTITFAGGSQILCCGLDDPEKIKSIHGVTSIWIEEATEITLKDFNQVNLRLRGQTPSYKQIILTFNPIDVHSWIKSRFFDENPQPENTLLHHSIFTDNIFDSTYEETLNSLTDRNHILIYKEGKWGELKGLIYENYEVVKDWPVEEFDCHGYGLDFGYSNSPTGCAEIGFIRDQLYIRELLYEKGLTNDQIAAKLKPHLSQTSYTAADCAEPKSIQELRNHGMLVIPCQKGPDSIVHGIQRVKQFQLKIHESAVNLQRELKAYKWAEDKNQNLLNKPVDAFNHLLDALRYSVVNLKGMGSAGITFEIEDKKAERKKEMEQPEYEMVNDEQVWTEWDE